MKDPKFLRITQRKQKKTPDRAEEAEEEDEEEAEEGAEAAAAAPEGAAEGAALEGAADAPAPAPAPAAEGGESNPCTQYARFRDSPFCRYWKTNCEACKKLATRAISEQPDLLAKIAAERLESDPQLTRPNAHKQRAQDRHQDPNRRLCPWPCANSIAPSRVRAQRCGQPNCPYRGLPQQRKNSRGINLHRPYTTPVVKKRVRDRRQQK
ncbi:hypothetical protein M885DRAFT_536753 [Pelagophyceae sp. CCMP2097]|nr:hypothetical protein M885DRAFT_536753 [Pelagophyceae sp. CCMP2097]